MIPASTLSTSPVTTTTPSPTYPNGTSNPFYPCGTTANEVATCPYRCYTSFGILLDQCYTKDEATTAINSLENICVKCVAPAAPLDYPGGCEPVDNYFSGAMPSPCGAAGHRLANCAWTCGEAQVPFSLCSAKNATGQFELCEKCVPQCSSPRIVFKPSAVPSNFSLSAGSCSEQYGQPEGIACPFRCTRAGRPSSFCSLNDITDSSSGGFNTCTACQ